MCLLDIRSGSSSVALLRPSGASKGTMCLELAANACGEHVDRVCSGPNDKFFMLNVSRMMNLPFNYY